MIWYPEIATALSHHTLADLLFDCLLDGWVVPSKLERAGSIGMALASVLSIQLGMEPEDERLRELCERLLSQIQLKLSPDRTFFLVVKLLKLVARAPIQDEPFTQWTLFLGLPDRLSTTHKLWWSRVYSRRFGGGDVFKDPLEFSMYTG